jgi:hypothetical protein
MGLLHGGGGGRCDMKMILGMTYRLIHLFIYEIYRDAERFYA